MIALTARCRARNAAYAPTTILPMQHKPQSRASTPHRVAMQVDTARRCRGPMRRQFFRCSTSLRETNDTRGGGRGGAAASGSCSD